MAKLIYSVIMSLDGDIEDDHGTFDWAVPDEAVHTIINDLERGLDPEAVRRMKTSAPTRAPLPPGLRR